MKSMSGNYNVLTRFWNPFLIKHIHSKNSSFLDSKRVLGHYCDTFIIYSVKRTEQSLLKLPAVNQQRLLNR